MNLFIVKCIQLMSIFCMFCKTSFEGLNDIEKDNILLNLLSNGKGSLDYTKNLVKFGVEGGSVPPFPDERLSWCVCGVRQIMPTEEENKC